MINVVFPSGYNEITAPVLTQWDYGQTLRIYGLNLPQAVQVHFCDKSCKKAVVRLGNAIVEADGTGYTEVSIPDILLENKWDIHAFIFVTDYEVAIGVDSLTEGTFYTRSGTSGNYTYNAVALPGDYSEGITYYRICGKTLKRIIIPLIERIQPEDFISSLTPSEQTMLEEMISAVNGTLDYIESLYNSSITVDELQQMIVETKVDEAAQADKATEAGTTLDVNGFHFTVGSPTSQICVVHEHLPASKVWHLPRKRLIYSNSNPTAMSKDIYLQLNIDEITKDTILEIEYKFTTTEGNVKDGSLNFKKISCEDNRWVFSQNLPQLTDDGNKLVWSTLVLDASEKTLKRGANQHVSAEFYIYHVWEVVE